MKIIVFVKQIPDTNDVKLDPKTGNLRRDGVKSRINPNDLNVIETAMELKRAHGAQVCAVTMGPPQAKTVLLKALALGCDEAYLLSDRAFGGADSLATAYTLSKAAEKIGGYDLLLTGRNSDDGDTAQVGAAIAAFLDIPQVTMTTALEVRDGTAYCSRTLEDRVEKLSVKLPALAAVTKDINSPDFARPVNIFSALDKPITVLDAAALGADTAQTGAAGSPSRTKKVFEPKKEKTATRYFTGTPGEMAAQIADVLFDEQMI